MSRSGAPTRRDVLRLAGAAAGASLAGCLGPGRRGRQGTILGPGRFIDTRTGTMSFVLCLFDLDTGGASTVPMGFFGHGLAPHPKDRHRAVIFEKKGPGCCEVDLAEGRVTRPITTPTSRAFYGHGAFSRDGSLLFATENHRESREGLICVRDGRSYAEIGSFPTHGKSPHDCHLVDEGRTLVITNGGGTKEETGEQAAPSVAFVDARSTKLLERLFFETKEINAGHLATTSAHDLVAISAPREGLPTTGRGGVTIRMGRGPFTTMTEPEEVVSRMVGESLSLCILEEQGVVGVTNPDGDIVTFWDMARKRLVKKLDLKAPRGLTLSLDKSQLALSYGAGTLVLVSPDTLEPLPQGGVKKSELSGSHLFTLDLPA